MHCCTADFTRLFAGAATDLAAKSGFEFTNGFVVNPKVRGPAFFKLDEGSLIESTITRGRNE